MDVHIIRCLFFALLVVWVRGSPISQESDSGDRKYHTPDIVQEEPTHPGSSSLSDESLEKLSAGSRAKRNIYLGWDLEDESSDENQHIETNDVNHLPSLPPPTPAESQSMEQKSTEEEDSREGRTEESSQKLNAELNKLFEDDEDAFWSRLTHLLFLEKDETVLPKKSSEIVGDEEDTNTPTPESTDCHHCSDEVDPSEGTTTLVQTSDEVKANKNEVTYYSSEEIDDDANRSDAVVGGTDNTQQQTTDETTQQYPSKADEVESGELKFFRNHIHFFFNTEDNPADETEEPSSPAHDSEMVNLEDTTKVVVDPRGDESTSVTRETVWNGEEPDKTTVVVEKEPAEEVSTVGLKDSSMWFLLPPSAPLLPYPAHFPAPAPPHMYQALYPQTAMNIPRYAPFGNAPFYPQTSYSLQEAPQMHLPWFRPQPISPRQNNPKVTILVGDVTIQMSSSAPSYPSSNIYCSQYPCPSH